MNLTAFLSDILPALSQLAKLTSTTVDDSLVEFVGLVISNPSVAAWLNSLLPHANDHAALGAAVAEAPAVVLEAAAGRGIDAGKLLAMVKAVMQLVALFAK